MRNPPQLKFGSLHGANLDAAIAEIRRELETKLNPFLREIGHVTKRHDQGLVGNQSGASIVDVNGDYLLLKGRRGGQIAHGATESGGALRLRSTAHGTKGLIYVGSGDLSAYDDVNEQLGLGTLTPSARLHAQGPDASVVKYRTTSPPDITASGVAVVGAASGSEACDEVSTDDDTTYIYNTPGPNNPNIEMRVVGIGTPTVDTGHVLRFRTRLVAAAGGMDMLWVLKQGAANIKTATVTLSTSYQTFEVTLSEAEAATITNYADLRVQFRASTTFNNENWRLTWVELELPASSGPGETVVFRAEAGIGQTLDLAQFINAGDVVKAAIGAEGHLKLGDDTGDFITLRAPAVVTTYTLILPAAQGAASSVLQNNGSGTLSFANPALLSALFSDVVANPPLRGAIIAGNSTPAWVRLALGSSGQALISNGTDLVYGAPTPAAHNLLSAQHGDTAVQGATKGSLVVGNSTPVWDELPIGTDTHVLTADSTQTLGVKWAAGGGGGGAHDLLSATHGDTVASAVSRGSLIYGNATPAWAELNIGSANQVLSSDGTDVSWQNRRRTRSEILQAADFVQVNGTSYSLTTYGTGSLKNVGRAIRFDDAPAATPQVWATMWRTPPDWVSGTTVTPYLWCFVLASLSDNDVVFHISITAITSPESTTTGPDSTLSKTVNVQAATGSGGDINNSDTLVRLAWPTFTPVAGALYKINLWRETAHASDTYPNDFDVAIVDFEYTSEA